MPWYVCVTGKSKKSLGADMGRLLLFYRLMLRPLMQEPVLVLNATYEPINVTAVRRAMVLIERTLTPRMQPVVTAVIVKDTAA